MAGFKADFTNITGPKQATDGLHTAQAKQAKAGVSNNDNIKIDLQWEITESADEGNVGVKVYDTITLTEAAFWKCAQLVLACELDTTALEGREVDMNYAQELAELLLGETITIKTKIKAGGWNKEKGERYPDRASVTEYQPYGAVTTVGDLLEADS